MSPRLVTQLTEDFPRVLLVSHDNNLRFLIENFYVRQGLDVVFFNLEKNQSELREVLKKDFYKIVVLETENDKLGLTSELSGFRNILKIRLLSSINPTNLKKSLLNLNLDNFIIGLDVVPKISQNWPLFKFITKRISGGVILNPEVDCYFQTEEAFFQAIKKLLISPQKKQVLIRGGKHSSGVVIDEIIRLFELFYGKKLQKKTSPIYFPLIDFSKIEIINQEAEALPSLLESTARELKFFNQEASQLSFHERSLEEPEIKFKPTPPLQEKNPLPPQKPEPDFKNLLGDGEFSSSTPKSTTKDFLTKNKDREKEATDFLLSKKTIDQQLSQIFKTERIEQKTTNIQESLKATKKIVKKTKKRRILFLLGLFFTTLAIALIILTGVFVSTKFSLEKTLANSIGAFSSQVGDKEKREDDLADLANKADFLKKQIEFYDLFLPPDILIEAKILTEVSLEIVEQSGTLLEFESLLEKQIAFFLGKDSLQDSEATQKLNQTAQTSYKVISKLVSQLESLRDGENDLEKQKEVKEFVSFLESQKEFLANFQQIYPLIDSLTGMRGKKTYGIVLQNNQELRPTGGFIQAVALVVVDQGMIVDVQVFSSYDLDKKLSGAVVPPDEIISLLGENKWYLRDSNWNPDFEVAGEQIAWFLEQETNKKIDGVVGINLFGIADLLKELGPLTMPEYNEVITDKNIYERSEFHSEIKLVESEETKDYLTNLLQHLLQDALRKGQEKPLSLLKALGKSLREKQTSVYFKNENQEEVFDSFGWTGKIINPDCPAQLSTISCQVDSLAVVDTNIGINKANYHTSREDKHLVEFQTDSVKHTRTIIFNNTAFVNAWPKGSYKSYLRVYLPPTAQGLSLKIDGIDVPQNQFSFKNEKNRILVELISETPIKTQKNIEIGYTIPLKFSLPYSYVFFNQKQPGTRGVLPEIVFKHEPNLSPTLIAPQAEVQGTAVIFNSLEEDHAFVGVSFK